VLKPAVFALAMIPSLAAAEPITDASFKAFALPDGVATKNLCMVKRTIGEDRVVQLRYVDGGHLTRTEGWRGTSALKLIAHADYTWAKGKVVALEDDAGKHQFTYGANGLRATWTAPYGTSKYVWKGTSVTPLVAWWPGPHEFTSKVPNQLPFAGTVEITETSKSKNVNSNKYAFEAHGTLLLDGCTADKDGHVATCKDEYDPTPQAFVWTSGELHEHTAGINGKLSRSTYEYDGKHRVTREQVWQGTDKAKLVLTEESRYEWRCDGDTMADPTWP
jgi:YD repeat-containing protein